MAEGKGPIDVLRATLPAGTLSGAPKVRAMEIIDELEPTKRGVYGGVVGYIDFSGNVDTAIAIRTMVVTPDGRASVQAGAGIVADSDPQSEDEECAHKARRAARRGDGGSPDERGARRASRRDRERHLEAETAALRSGAGAFRPARDVVAVQRAGSGDLSAGPTEPGRARTGGRRVGGLAARSSPTGSCPPCCGSPGPTGTASCSTSKGATATR